METVTFNDAKFQAQLNALADVLISSGVQSDPAVIVADEARLFLKQAINLTPPQKGKAQGEQAALADIKRIFTGADESFLLYEFGNSGANIDRWFTNKKGEKVHAQFEALDIHGAGMRQYHTSQRNSRGRTVGRHNESRQGSDWKARYVVSYGALADYSKKILSRVGMRKSGWLRAYYEMGGKLPAWIQRHASRGLGRAVNNLATPGKPSVVMASHAPGVMDDERIIADTFRARREAMAKRIRLIVSGYAADVKAGIKISNKARRTA